jgi:hypothetical protein
VQFYPRLEGRSGLTIVTAPHVPGGHADDRIVVLVENFRTGKAGIELDAQ